MATISSLGSAAGIDGEAIIKQLLTVESAPKTKVQTENSTLSTNLSTWGRIQSAFAAVRDTANALNKDDFWKATTAKSADDTAVSVTSSTSSTAGNYSVAVQSLAQSQYIASQAYGAKTDVVGEGTLTIELGTFTDNPSAPPAATFAAKAAASAVNISIGPGDNTLEKIRDKINAANAGVTASLITDASGARLVVRGTNSGEENGFRISVADADGGNGDGTGLSALAYDPSADITSMTRSQKAANAKATINGIEVNSDTNTLKDVVDGLTITLKKVTDTATESKPIELTVEQDLTSIRTGIDAFAKAYNDAIGLIRTQTMYDAESKTGGPLQGDSTAVGLLNQLRSMAGTGTTASSMYSRLSDIGLQMGKEGTFTTNGTKLDKALKDNLDEVRKFFSTANDADPNAAGMGQRFYKMANQIAGSDGSIAARQDGIKSTIKRNEKKIDDIDNRLTLVEARLRAQYTALDNNMTKLNSLSAYVAQQLSVLTNS